MAHEKYAVVERKIVGNKQIVFLGTKKDCQKEADWCRRQNRASSFRVLTEEEARAEVKDAS